MDLVDTVIGRYLLNWFRVEIYRPLKEIRIFSFSLSGSYSRILGHIFYYNEVFPILCIFSLIMPIFCL